MEQCIKCKNTLEGVAFYNGVCSRCQFTPINQSTTEAQLDRIERKLDELLGRGLHSRTLQASDFYNLPES